MSDYNHEEGFANAELQRRFNNFLLDGRIAAINADAKTVDIKVFTASDKDDLIIKGLLLMNVAIEQVSTGFPIVLFCAQGAIETGLVYVLGPDPEQKAQNERIKKLEAQVAQLRQHSFNNNN